MYLTKKKKKKTQDGFNTVLSMGGWSHASHQISQQTPTHISDQQSNLVVMGGRESINRN